jgi:hypothetical protein
MSYIRCLSNPERLYVYTSYSATAFSWNDPRKGSLTAACTKKDWWGFVRKFETDSFSETFGYGHISARAVLVSTVTGKVVKHSPSFKTIEALVKTGKPLHIPEHKVMVTIQQVDGTIREIILWRVTFMYMMNNALKALKWERKNQGTSSGNKASSAAIRKLLEEFDCKTRAAKGSAPVIRKHPKTKS